MLERNGRWNAGVITNMDLVVSPLIATSHVQVIQEKYVEEDGLILSTLPA